jgi:type II secretory pathway pseudopilin PulG
MKTLHPDSGKSKLAFTLLELIVIFTIICVLLAILIPGAIKARAKARRITCVGHLANVGLSFKIFATDNRELFPWQMATNSPTPTNFDMAIRHYLAISNELSTPLILHCPADTRKAAENWHDFGRINISYLINLDSAETFPRTILAGDQNILTNGARIGPGIVKLDMAITNVAWDGSIHRFQGNVTMGDGSVQQLSSARLPEHWTNQGTSSVTLAVP